jgi:two-component system cell cycle response regulator
LRAATDTAFRYGGEEFVIILAETDADNALSTVERIRRAVREPQVPHVAGIGGTVTISGGVAVTNADPSDDPQTLLARADTALYAAKDAGRDRVHGAEPPKASGDLRA